MAEDERLIRIPAMVAVMRAIAGDAITGVHRTRLTPDGRMVDRRMLGVARGAAIKLDADENVTTGLHVAEGVETALAARSLGFRPTWALGSSGAIARLAVVGGVECINFLAENDAANREAVAARAERWNAAGREIIIIEPTSGSDLNDAIRGAA